MIFKAYHILHGTPALVWIRRLPTTISKSMTLSPMFLFLNILLATWSLPYVYATFRDLEHAASDMQPEITLYVFSLWLLIWKFCRPV